MSDDDMTSHVADDHYAGGRREALLEIAAYCDQHVFDRGGHPARVEPAWATAMRDVAQHCRGLVAKATP